MPPVEGQYSDDPRNPKEVVDDAKEQAWIAGDIPSASRLHGYRKSEGNPPRASQDQGDSPVETPEDRDWRISGNPEQR